MKKSVGKVLSAACAVAMFTVWAMPSMAQTSEVKEKPPMYSYVANWIIPRAQWANYQKSSTTTEPVLQKALANGTIVAYGTDETMIHTVDGSTQDNWWSAMSLAGLLNTLDEIYKAGGATNPALESATKHWDNVWVSRYYNWRPGTHNGVYTMVSQYQLKQDAPDDAVDSLSGNLVAPLLEKMLADGTIAEYEIDTQAIHTDAPGTFLIVYLANNAEGLDKVNAAIRATLKAQPLAGPAFGSMTKSSAHRDELARTNAIYK
jgi:hypothetical protein